MSRKLWSYSVGERPNIVRVFERKGRASLYVRTWDPEAANGRGGWRMRALGHADRARAKAYAAEMHAKLAAGAQDVAAGRVTLGRLFALYERHRTPRKTTGEQKTDKRRIELWTRFLGADRDPLSISLREWETFQDLRASGEIDARGKRVTNPKRRRPVRTRSVEADLKWLRWALNWGRDWRLESGAYLLRENPVRGFEIPTEKNPRRPVASRDRFEAIRKKTDQVTMECRWEGKREIRRSYLSEIFEIVFGTGRRISAVLGLRFDNLRLERTSAAPHGAIRWPADTDKEGRESLVPVAPEVRAAIDRRLADRPVIGGAYLFPSPTDPGQPVSKELASDWLREAEKLAKLPTQQGSLWHAYRRGWATARKHLPAQDVATAGGWSGVETLQAVYQQADAKTLLRVVLEPAELREVRS